MKEYIPVVSFLNNENKFINKNGCNTYGSFGRFIGDGGDPSNVKRFCEVAVVDLVIDLTFSSMTVTPDTYDGTVGTTTDILLVLMNSANQPIIYTDEVVEFISSGNYLTAVNNGDGTYTSTYTTQSGQVNEDIYIYTEIDGANAGLDVTMVYVA